MKPIRKWKALFDVKDAKTSDEPEPLALALIEAERCNVELVQRVQAQRILIDELTKKNEELDDTLKNFMELLEVYVIESDLSTL